MPYYKKKIALELYISVAVEAENAEEAKELIESINLHGKNLKIDARNVFDVLVFPKDIPEEISEEQYRRMSVKAHKGG